MLTPNNKIPLPVRNDAVHLLDYLNGTKQKYEVTTKAL